jgi:putative flippase GtrA
MFLQFLKYNLVGIVNTLTGFSIILGLMYMGFSATISNVIGYAIGAVISYALNSKYTFDSSRKHQETMIKFFIVLGIAYILNFMTLQWLLMAMNPYTAQLGAATVYTVSSFVMARYFVFAR